MIAKYFCRCLCASWVSNEAGAVRALYIFTKYEADVKQKNLLKTLGPINICHKASFLEEQVNMPTIDSNGQDPRQLHHSLFNLPIFCNSENNAWEMMSAYVGGQSMVDHHLATLVNWN